MLSLLHVAGLELPVGSGILDAIEEALALLGAPHVEPELDDARAVPGEVLLELADRLVALVEEDGELGAIGQALALEDLRVDLHHQHLFVVAAVPDPDVPALRKASHAAPEKVVIELELGGPLEVGGLDPCRVHPGHHRLDGSVLSCGVHRLEDHQQRALIVGHEARLELAVWPHNVRPARCIIYGSA